MISNIFVYSSRNKLVSIFMLFKIPNFSEFSEKKRKRERGREREKKARKKENVYES